MYLREAVKKIIIMFSDQIVFDFKYWKSYMKYFGMNVIPAISPAIQHVTN